jgi:hypothetical protein
MPLPNSAILSHGAVTITRCRIRLFLKFSSLLFIGLCNEQIIVRIQGSCVNSYQYNTNIDKYKIMFLCIIM